jgi:dephospho-CoA kinase
MRKFKMITIGLTGGIGSGKTNVGKVLSELGAKVLYF